MTDQDDRSRIVPEIADRLIRNQPTNREFVDVSPDTGFLETIGQAIHPPRKDRAERAAEQVDARLRLSRGWRRVGGDRRDSIGRACSRTGDRHIADGRQDADGKGCTDHHGCNQRRTSHVHSARDLGVEVPDLECRRATPPSALRVIYRRGISRICGARSWRSHLNRSNRTTTVPPRRLPCRASSRLPLQVAAASAPPKLVQIGRRRQRRSRLSPSAA